MRVAQQQARPSRQEEKMTVKRAHCISRREVLAKAAKASAVVAAASQLAGGQSSGTARSGGPSDVIDDLVIANHVLAQQGILDAYGHVSVRKGTDRYLMSRSLAPALVTPADILEYDLDSVPIADGGRKSFVERFIHGEIYKSRPDVQAVIHSHTPDLIPFGVTQVELKPIYHMSAFVGEGVPVFEIRKYRKPNDPMPMLVHNPALGRALAQTLGGSQALLMRGHGAAIVGSHLGQVVARAVYLVMNASLQAKAMALGGSITYLDQEEVRAKLPDEYERAWQLWKAAARKDTP
jgi:ribulose-5-phosphate 4-epimerase/fuculose-1-phosphate aldolase